MCIVHYYGGARAEKDSHYDDWRCDWKPCVHLDNTVLVDKQHHARILAEANLEVWGTDPNSQGFYTRVWCKRCAKAKGYTW